MRRSLRSHRAPREFREARAHLQILEWLEARGEFRVFYRDEPGFSLTPVIPYARQRGRRELAVPKGRPQACQRGWPLEQAGALPLGGADSKRGLGHDHGGL